MVATREKIAIAAPNGSGKSERIIACAALRWISVAPKEKVVITSKDGCQIDNHIWPALMKRRGKFEDYTWKYRKVLTSRGAEVTALTTDEASRMEGWHANIPRDDQGNPLLEHPEFSPVLIIVDEAKSVTEEIFQAIDRCIYNVLLLISSTELMQGRFYEAHTTLPGWHTLRHDR